MVAISDTQCLSGKCLSKHIKNRSNKTKKMWRFDNKKHWHGKTHNNQSQNLKDKWEKYLQFIIEKIRVILPNI